VDVRRPAAAAGTVELVRAEVDQRVGVSVIGHVDHNHLVYLVCAAAKPNELALRLARATRPRQMIVVDVAYHGNTNALIDLSPYKFNGPGGRGRPAHVHVVPTPDRYRGSFRVPPMSAMRRSGRRSRGVLLRIPP